MIKFDNLSEAIHSIGAGQSGYSFENPSSAGWFYQERWFYSQFYANSWHCQRVCNTRPMQMQGAWGKFELADGEIADANKVNRQFNYLRKKYCQAQISANRDGGASILRLIDDGRDLSQPVDLNRIKSIRWSRVFDRWEIYTEPDSYEKNPLNPEYYLVALNGREKIGEEVSAPEGSFFNESLFYYKIHRDRVVRFRGYYIDNHTLTRNQGWECSKLLPFLPPLLKYVDAMGYVSDSVKTFELVVFSVDQLFDMVEKQKERLIERMQLNQQSMSAIRSLMADLHREKVDIVSRRYQGVAEILQELRLELKGASGLDDIELFGEHPAGLQATGQSERLEKARQIKECCEYEWGHLLEGDLDSIGDLGYYLLSKESPFNGMPDDWEWIWNSSILLTPEEEADRRDKYAQIDQRNISSGIYAGEEARSRYSSSEFNTELTLMDKMPEPLPEPKTQPKEDKFSIEGELLDDVSYDELIRQSIDCNSSSRDSLIGLMCASDTPSFRYEGGEAHQ